MSLVSDKLVFVKKIIIIFFLIFYSPNAYSINIRGLLELIGDTIPKILDSREFQYTSRYVLKWFFTNREYERKFKNKSEQNLNMEFQFYVESKNKDWLKNFKLKDELAIKQSNAVTFLKNDLKSRNYKKFVGNNFYLICSYRTKLFSFVFFEDRNTLFMNEAITPYRLIKNVSIDNELMVFHSNINDKTLIFTNYKKNKKSYYNWYFFHLRHDGIFFEHKINYALNYIDKPKSTKDSDIHKINNCEIDEN